MSFLLKTVIKATLLIQRWYRRYMARIEMKVKKNKFRFKI